VVVNNELEVMWKEAVIACLVFYVNIYLKGVEKTKKILTKCFERELSREPSEYEPEA
jgi:hypothetical protein